MRGDLRGFTVLRPRRLAEALRCLADDERPQPLAGGTDLYVALNDGHSPATAWLDLTRLDELRGISPVAGGLRLGALVTFAELKRSRAILRRAPVLAEMAATVGAAAIQNRGTLGGSLGNASPASDPAPVLQALDARVELAALDGRRIARREVPLAEFFLTYRTTAARPEELITAVRVPAEALAGWRCVYRKVGARRAQAISKVVMAAAFRLEGRPRRIAEARISFGSVAPVTLRCPRTEEALRGRAVDARTAELARETLAGEIRPIDDIRSTAVYRARVAGNVLARAIAEL